MGIHIIFFLISPRKHVVANHVKRIGDEALLMSTHNICFCGEIRKISEHFSDEKSTLSVNPAGGRIQLMTDWHFIAQSLLLSPFRHLRMTSIMLLGM